MRYKKPFTSQQREAAAHVYRSLCASFEVMRRKFRPKTPGQRIAARELRQAIEDFASTLRNPNDKVDVNRLNVLQTRATLLALDYSREYLE